jgi:tRNA pseudouridine55 synthase
MAKLSIDGILNINKPVGKTSFEVVAFVRKLSGEARVGHGGTLDPEATGVLPIGLGRGTRMAEFLAAERKVYQAQVELGTATDTYDASGKVTYRGDASTVTKEQAEAALASFRGLIQQTPPLYSALKYQGQPLYRLARAGIEVPRSPRKVNVFRL